MSAHSHHDDEGKSESTAYETRDVKIRPLAVFVAGLTVVTIATYAVVYLILKLYSAQATKQDAQLQPVAGQVAATQPGDERLPPEPRIQANPPADLKVLRDQEDAILTTYGWVDARGGVVRVPIDVAMQQVLEQGLPVRQPEIAPPASGTPAQAATPRGQNAPPKASK